MKSTIPVGSAGASTEYSGITGAANSYLNNWQDKITLGREFKGYDIAEYPYYAKKNSEPYLKRPEMRARSLANEHSFTDPFVPNFKVFVDFSKTYGLFGCDSLDKAADPKYINSAMAYLCRIEGAQSPRAILLQMFIEQFKLLLKEYDYLILNVEGLDELYTIYNKHQYVEETEIKCNIVIREIVTMQIAGLINLYNQIWYDPIRNVEILPENLRRFDMYIMVFSAGYFNSLLYDMMYKTNTETDSIRKIFPTAQKLHKLYEASDFGMPDFEFNAQTFLLASAQFDMLESGKKIFSDISNEMGAEVVKNNLSVTAKFVHMAGKFAQFDGSVDLCALLALLNRERNNGKTTSNFSFRNYFKTYGSNVVKSLISAGTNSIDKFTGSVFDNIRGLMDPNQPLGNALSLLASPDAIAKKLTSAVDVGLNGIKKYVDVPGNWLQNMVSNHFNDNILSDLMAAAVSKINNTAVEGPKSMDKINENIKKLPNDIEIDSVPSAQSILDKIQSSNKTVKKQVTYEKEIPEYTESDNKSKNNISWRKRIQEYAESDNKNNLEYKKEIPEYTESDNKSKNNISWRKRIQEYAESDNKNNLEYKKEIPEYTESDNKSKNNISWSKKIPEFIESDNKKNIEYSETIDNMETKDDTQEIYRTGSTRTQRENLMYVKEIFKSERPSIKNTRF